MASETKPRQGLKVKAKTHRKLSCSPFFFFKEAFSSNFGYFVGNGKDNLLCIKAIQRSCSAILHHYSRAFATENFLRQHENNCKLTAITVMESSSISSSDGRKRRNSCEKEGASHNDSNYIMIVLNKSFRCSWDNMRIFLCNVPHVRKALEILQAYCADPAPRSWLVDIL